MATLIWQNCDRSSVEVYFETTAEYGRDLQINPDSWLLYSAKAAMRYGEKRIKIDAPISPKIKDGLINAMKCMINWQVGDRQINIAVQSYLGVSSPKGLAALKDFLRSSQ